MNFKAFAACSMIATFVVGLAQADAEIQASARPLGADDAIRCANSTVSKIGFYFTGDPTSGIYAVYATTLGMTHFPHARASVTDRTPYVADDTHVGGWKPSADIAGVPNPIMLQERVGDRVQVCLVGTPTPTDRCDPGKDSRGRIYRVYDYRLHAAYVGENGNHACGGA